MLQRPHGNFHVVEGHHTFFRDLMLFVALACNENDIACLGFMNGQLDRFPAVWLQSEANFSALQSGKSVVHDGDGVFAAGVVAGKDDEVATASCGLTHQRALGAVAVAAASENSQDSPGPAALVKEIMCDGREVADGVVGVSVVHDHRKWLTKIEPLETASDMGNLVSSLGNGVRLHVAGVGGRCRSQGSRWECHPAVSPF